MGKYNMSYKGGMKANIIPNNQVKWKLQSADGKVFGEVSYNAYKAVENFKLDSYKPASKKEKKILTNYKNHVGIQVAGADGKPIGKVSYDGYNAILKGTYDSYKPKSNEEKTTLEKAIKEPLFPLVIEVDGKRKNFGNISYNARQYLNKYNTFDSVKSSDQKSTYWYVASNETEKKTIDKYKKFTEEYAKKQREPESVPQGIVHSLGYTVEKVGAGAADVMGDAGDFILGTGATILRPFTWGKANEAVKNYADYRFNADTLGDLWNESVESRYRVPDWYRENVGTIAYNFGGLVPATVAEVVTASSAPTYETIFAKSLGTAGKKSVAMNLASKLIKPKASDTVFFLGAAGSSTKGAYAETGNAVSSISYGVLNGVGEVFSERLFGGYGGTGIGAADDTVRAGNRILKAGLSNEIFDLRKIKGISKLASNKYGKKVLDIAMEGVEEMVMADLEPWIKKATIDPDAEISNFTQADFWKERGSAFASGVMLSAFSNAITYPTSKAINKISTAKQKTSAIKTLNEDISKINAVLPSDAQFAPLTRKSSVKQIEAMASDIQRTKAIIEVNAVSDGINAILKNDSDKLQLLKYDSTVEEIKQRQREIAVFGVTTADFMAEELVKNNPEKFADIKAEAEANGVELVPKSTEKPSETPTVSVGDTFIESETNKTIKVISRNEDVSSIELITADGKKETKVLSNKIVDTLKTNDKFVQVESSSDTLTTGVDDNIIKDNIADADGKEVDVMAVNNKSKTTLTPRQLSNIASIMEGTFKLGEASRLVRTMEQNGSDVEEFIYAMINRYRETGSLQGLAKYFEDEGKSVIEAIESLEGENNGEVLLHEHTKGNDESSGEQIEGVQGTEEEVGGRSYTAENLRNEGKTERINIDKDNSCEVIKEDAYTEDMLELAGFLKKYGLEAKFFVGDGWNSAENVEFAGCIVGGKEVYIQYDHAEQTPEMIAKHEIIHSLYGTAIIKKIRNILKNSYSVAELNHILNDGRYSGYMEIYKDTGKVFEEFVCDTLSGMNGQSMIFETLVNAFWSNDFNSIDNYKVSEYAEETDAGGEEGKTLREAYRAERKAEIEKSKERLGIADNNESSEIAEGEIRYSIFPGGVFPPYNKSHSDANERATRWAHNEDIETGAQRIFFYKGAAYLVEKFDSMDLGYLVVEKLKKKDLSRYERNMIEYEKRNNDGTDNGLQPGRKGAVSDTEPNKGFRESGRGSTDDNNSSDRHNGETAEVQGMDREQDGKRSSEHNGSRDNEHSVEDREREVKYNLSGKKNDDSTDKLFAVSDEVKTKLSKQIDKWLNGKMSSNEVFEFGKTPIVLKELGAADLPVVMSQSTMAKINGVKHDVSLEIIRNLPQSIAEPIMVFKSDTVPNSFVILTEMDDMNGKPIVAALHLNKKENRLSVNRITSIYGKDGIKGFLTEQVKKGNLKYLDKIKSQNWSTSRGLQLPKLVQSNPDNNSILQKEDIVKKYSMQKSKNNSSVKYSIKTKDKPSEDKINDEWAQLLEEYGAIESGAHPARDIKVPKKTAKRKYTSKFARSLMEAGIMPDDSVDEFKELVIKHKMSHIPITDEAAKAYANAKIDELGFDGAFAYWGALADAEAIPGKNDIVLGEVLLNHCLTVGDVINSQKIAVDLAHIATATGQATQAFSMLQKMSPDGQLYCMEKSIQTLNRELKKQLGKKWKNEEIELNHELAEKFLTADSEEERKILLSDIHEHIALQIQATPLEKFDAWRYLSMLGNPRTHIRNVVGNAIMVPARKLKNYIGAVLELTFIKDKSQRTKSIRRDKDALEFAKNDFEKVQNLIKGYDGKYDIQYGEINEKRRIFKNKFLESLRRFNMNAMETEDMWFLKSAYIDSMAQLMTARGLTAEQLNDGTRRSAKMLDVMRALSIKEAQEATYRDANFLADMFNKAKRSVKTSNNPLIKGGWYGIVEGLMPFKKTPLNIAKRGVEYSPAYVIKALVYDTVKVREGTMTGNDFINDLSKGLTGTALLFLGAFLANVGLISGSDDENKKKRKFDETVGFQGYALKIGNYTYTIDWLAPPAMPLFVGVELMNGFKEDGISFQSITRAGAKILEPILELSCLQGISGAIEAANFNETNALSAVALDAISSYITQAVPTMSGQITRTADKTRRNIYVDKNSNIPQTIQTISQLLASKIPFASHMLEPRLDVWGREITYGNDVFFRTFSNFFSPGYVRKIDDSKVTEELNLLYTQTGESKVYPIVAAKQIKIGKEDAGKYGLSPQKINLTGEQYTFYARKRGQYSLEMINSLIVSDKYKKMTNEGKIEAISDCYTEAGKKAKKNFIEEYLLNSNDKK